MSVRNPGLSSITLTVALVSKRNSYQNLTLVLAGLNSYILHDWKTLSRTFIQLMYVLKQDYNVVIICENHRKHNFLPVYVVASVTALALLQEMGKHILPNKLKTL